MARGFGGMPGGGNMQALMQQAQKMQKDIEKTKLEIENAEFEGSAGGGAVTFKINGKYEVLDVSVKPEAIDPSDKEMLEGMIRGAANDALSKVREHSQAKMAQATGGFSIPGL